MKIKLSVIIEDRLWRGATKSLPYGCLPTELIVNQYRRKLSQEVSDYLFECRKVLCSFSSICREYSCRRNWDGFECKRCLKFYDPGNVYREDQILDGKRSYFEMAIEAERQNEK